MAWTKEQLQDEYLKKVQELALVDVELQTLECKQITLARRREALVNKVDDLKNELVAKSKSEVK